MRVETIKIVDNNEQGFKVINLSDFNDKVHQKYLPSTAELRAEAKEKGIKIGGRATAETIAKKIEEAKVSGEIEEDL